MDPFERGFEESGYDLDFVIQKLTEVQLDSPDQSSSSVSHHQQVKEEETSNENLTKNGAEWIELLFGEMTSASDIKDAKSRASRVLQALENAIETRATQTFFQEIEAVTRKAEALDRENKVLKRLVAVQFEHQKGSENTKSELAKMENLLTQYQNQLRTLEVKNYALTLQLKQALNGNSFPAQSNQLLGF